MTQEANNISLAMLQEVIDYIEDNLLQEMTPGIIAGQFYVSVSTLSSLFKIICGMTIMEYIRNRRLTLAAEELATSNVHIIDLAYKYGYETPEAFTKAFSRFHGFPPSFIRRSFPVTKVFRPLQIRVDIRGGWTNPTLLTKSDCLEQECFVSSCYNYCINSEGGKQMVNRESKYQIDVSKMQYKREWNVLYALAQDLLQSHIPFKVDGKTMLFAHGLELQPDKICLTFKWKDEESVKGFFHYDMAAKYAGDGFKYFDVMYKTIKIRCMFYGDCPGADTDEFLYKNTDIVYINNLAIPVQSLEFYLENAETNTECYKMVQEWFEKKGGTPGYAGL